MTEAVLDRVTITFIVTKECNFRCGYCYMVRKHGGARMPFSVAKKAIDYFLGNRDRFPQKRVVFEFIGGEPLLEVDLIEKICDYVVTRSWELDHPWFGEAGFSVSTNGALYDTPKFQRLLDQYGDRFEVGLTIDGPPHVHDRERKFPNGEGTHAQVVRNVPLWLERSKNAKPSTKVTISHETLPYVSESILYLFSIGIPTVHANVVFENVWQDGDDALFEAQLNLLGDALIEKGWHTKECSLFNRSIGKPDVNTGNWCGAGKYMLAVDAEGKLYPCVRFTDFSLQNQPAIVVGDIDQGVIWEKLEPFYKLTRACQSTTECMSCEVGAGCAWCQGFNYDDSGVLNHRATYLCKMHKARVRANKRYWDKIDSIGDR